MNFFQKLNNGTHIYFCGLKEMMSGGQDTLQNVVEAKDVYNKST